MHSTYSCFQKWGLKTAAILAPLESLPSDECNCGYSTLHKLIKSPKKLLYGLKWTDMDRYLRITTCRGSYVVYVCFYLVLVQLPQRTCLLAVLGSQNSTLFHAHIDIAYLLDHSQNLILWPKVCCFSWMLYTKCYCELQLQMLFTIASKRGSYTVL